MHFEKSISKLNVTIHSVRQGEAKGLGHAILCAKTIIQFIIAINLTV